MLRSAILKAADEREIRVGKRPKYLVMSFELVKLLLGRQVSRAMVRRKEHTVYSFEGTRHIMQIHIADPQLGSSFNYLCDDLSELDDHIADLFILQT